MDFLIMDIYEIGTYGLTAFLIAGVIYWYLRKAKSLSQITANKLEIAKESGRFEPISLYPHIDPLTCIGSGACISACPEKDVLGLMNARGTLINTTSCIGHGACFEACPVDAISLRIGTEKRGVDLPHVNPDYQTNVDGIYIAGELGGMGLIKNSIEQGIEAVNGIHARCKNKTIEIGETDVLNLLVVGAGPAGIGAALRAKELGLSYTVLEQESLGGTVFTYPRSKVVMTHPVDLPLYGEVKLTNTSKEELLAIWEDIRTTYNLNIREGMKVESVQPEQEYFNIELADGSSIKAHNVLLAIGRRGTPRKLNVPGELSTKVAYRLLDAEHIEGERILVVGGGDSAVESAMLLMEQNSVYLSYRKGAFARIKAGNQTLIDKAIEDKALEVLFESQVQKIDADDIYLKQNDEDLKLEDIDRIYIFAGGELPTQFLQKAGITMELAKNKVLKKH